MLTSIVAVEQSMGTEFVPGEFWTPERALAAVQRMTGTLESPAMQAMMSEIASGAEQGADPAALAAAIAASQQPKAARTAPVRADECVYRRGHLADVPQFAQLIISGELPPMFIEEFAEGFVAVEHGGQIIGCGGLEVYGDCGVIRSVVVDEAARGMRIGERMAELLMEEARAADVSDVYLFTMHAAPFWRRLGFIDAPLPTWKAPPRVSWQYRFISEHPDAAVDVIPMWRPATLA